MTNLTLYNKKSNYNSSSEGTNVRIEGQVYVDDTHKVTDYNGSVYAIGEQSTWIGYCN